MTEGSGLRHSSSTPRSGEVIRHSMSQQQFIDFKDVWLAYNDELLREGQFAVEAIDLQVRQGEFIAIVGPSGCGKSTFMKLATAPGRPCRRSSAAR
jgi:NitT/TauT family transport system ATP-binding protein